MRLKSELFVQAFIRRCEQAGGFVTLRRRGDPDAGQIVFICENAQSFSLWTPRYSEDPSRRVWQVLQKQDSLSKEMLSSALEGILRHDRDVWFVDVDGKDAPYLFNEEKV